MQLLKKLMNYLHTLTVIYIGISCTGIRFFTVYGPWGRPDMAPMIFTKAILSKKPIRFLIMEICLEILLY